MLEAVRPTKSHMTVPVPAAQDLSRDAFLSAMRQAASPVCVVTTQSEGQRMALTISSFLSISADPPLISVCINRNSRMCTAMTESGRFGVHLLADDQAHIADNFAGRPQSGEAYDFSCVEWIDQGDEGEPFMSGVSVSADCAVVSTADAGTHRLFIASVKSLTTNDKRPLLYWNRLYGFPSHPADAQN